jgi:hypothetical protein
MPHLSTPRRKPTALIALAIMLLACAGLTACGSSSPSTSSTAANAAATSTPAQGAAATKTSGAGATGTTPSTPPPAPAGASRFAAVRECLAKNGVTLPARPRGGTPGALLGGARPSGGFKPPKGMTSAQYQEVLKKCGGGGFRPGNFHRGAGGARRAFNSARFRQAITSFAACLRQNGIDIPAPNTSGKGPVFSTKGINTASPKFKQAEVKCRPALLAGLRSGARAGTSAGARGGTATTG